MVANNAQVVHTQSQTTILSLVEDYCKWPSTKAQLLSSSCLTLLFSAFTIFIFEYSSHFFNLPFPIKELIK